MKYARMTLRVIRAEEDESKIEEALKEKHIA
jgi:hypothetical protein